MRYDVRIPGYGGAGVYLRRTIAGDPPGRKAVDIWLLSPEYCEAALARATKAEFLASFGRYLFAVAGESAPEKRLASFADLTAGISVDVVTSDENRIGLAVRVIADLDVDVVDYLDMDFETTRTVLASTAQTLATLAGNIDLVDFEELG